MDDEKARTIIQRALSRALWEWRDSPEAQEELLEAAVRLLPQRAP